MPLIIKNKKNLRRQFGVGLIEVLIALLLVSTGVLSIIYLQTKVVSTTMSSYQETQASLHLQEMIEILRANKSLATKGDFNTRLVKFSQLGKPEETVIDKKIHNWYRNINNNIPSIKVLIQCTADSHCILEIESDRLIDKRKQSLAFIL